MPIISHVRTYTKKLETDTYTISKVCCEKMKMVDPTWNYCPYCGEAVSVEEVKDVVEVK